MSVCENCEHQNLKYDDPVCNNCSRVSVKNKQAFVEWLEKRYSAMSATHPTSYIEGYTDALEVAIDKAKEML